MEELQSTEILEREILEDARKKALRFLKTAEEAAAAKIAGWDQKTEKHIADLRMKHNEKKEAEKEKIMARLPIDKLRIKVEKIDNFIKKAIEDWFKNTPNDKIIDLLKIELAKRLEFCKGINSAPDKKAYYSGMEKKDAQEVLKKSNIEVQDMEELKSANPYPAIIIETENTRILVSIQEIINFLLYEKRQELAHTLLGKELIGEN